MQADLELLQRGKSVKRQRTVEQHWATTRNLAIGTAVLALLVTALASLRGWKQEHTPNPEAVRLYKLGRHHYHYLTPKDFKRSYEYLNQAVRADPQFLQPYRELTAICVWNSGVFTNKAENAHKVKEIADKLLATAPGLAEGHAALSWWHFMGRDWCQAELEIVRAIELNRDYAHARDIYSFYLSMQGRTDEAHNQSKRAQELDPDARTTAMVAAWPFMAARQFDKAIAQLQRVIQLDKNFPEAHMFLAQCYEAQSNYIAAIEEYKITDLQFGEDADETTKYYAALRQAYDTDGEQGYWQESLKDYLSKPEEQRPAQDIAACYAKLGRKEEALEELEKHLDDIRWHQLKFVPQFDTLHDDPRFKALLKRAGLDP